MRKLDFDLARVRGRLDVVSAEVWNTPHPKPTPAEETSTGTPDCNSVASNAKTAWASFPSSITTERRRVPGPATSPFQPMNFAGGLAEAKQSHLGPLRVEAVRLKAEWSGSRSHASSHAKHGS